ncbi:MAG: hypothetical protein OXF79_04900 [Chloroflexi bacterium]|nr:hypothetical protein [Chloroflexota bacterium]
MTDTTRTFSGFESRSSAKIITDPNKPGWDTDFQTAIEHDRNAGGNGPEEEPAAASSSAE